MIRNDIRKAGRLFLSVSLWRKRVVFWLGAVAIGIMAGEFAFVADDAQLLFRRITAESYLLPLLVCPAVFALTAGLTSRFCPGATGSGIPQAIAARIVTGKAEQTFLLGKRVIAGKILLTALALAGGASVGREGPTVQVGAGLLCLCAGFGGVSRKMTRTVILAGAAAGVAAAFNTPIAGIVFVIEEMARAFEHRDSGIVMTAIVLAGVASMSILGNYTYFGTANAEFSLAHDWLAILAIGAGGGLLGAVFAKILIDGGPWLRNLARPSSFAAHPAVFGGICGLAIAGLGLLTRGATYGTGYIEAKNLLQGTGHATWVYALAKFLATAISGFAGIPGGIFSPSLSVGAAFGAILAPIFHGSSAQGIILLGMTAYFAGVTQAPITAFVIVLEITGKQVMPVPLIAASMIAAAVARLFCPVSLYHALAKSFIAETHAKEAETIILPPPDSAALPAVISPASGQAASTASQ